MKFFGFEFKIEGPEKKYKGMNTAKLKELREQEKRLSDVTDAKVFHREQVKRIDEELERRGEKGEDKSDKEKGSILDVDLY